MGAYQLLARDWFYAAPLSIVGWRTALHCIMKQGFPQGRLPYAYKVKQCLPGQMCKCAVRVSALNTMRVYEGEWQAGGGRPPSQAVCMTGDEGRQAQHLQAGLVGGEDGELTVSLLLDLVVAARARALLRQPLSSAAVSRLVPVDGTAFTPLG